MPQVICVDLFHIAHGIFPFCQILSLNSAAHVLRGLGKLLFFIQFSVTDLPQHMAHLTAVVVASDLGLPIAPHNLQRIVKPEQKFHILLIAGVQQLLMELLSGTMG